MKIWQRYLRRYVYRGTTWAIRMTFWGILIATFELLLRIDASGWAVVGAVGAWAAYAISEAIKQHTAPVHLVNCKNVTMSKGAIMSVPKDAFDAAVGRLLEQEAFKKATMQ
jgi:hypothetical protein